MMKTGKRIAAAAILLMLCAFVACTLAEGDPLSYELLPDGSGYRITGCAADAVTVTVPAEHEGLPVVSVAEGAFRDCTDLQEFLAGEGQQAFYTDQGVLFTDRPVKTLVCWPADNRQVKISYTVPEDTAAIGPYAFASQKNLSYLHLPEGVASLGDCAFAGNSWSLWVYVPDSLTVVGEDLMRDSIQGVAFYGRWECAMAEYARAHMIPFGGVSEPEPFEVTAVFGGPDLTEAEDAPEVDPSRIAYEDADDFYPYNDLIPSGYNLSAAQASAPSEIRLGLDSKWSALVPEGYPASTGVYGLGWTAEPAWLRGYDAQGNVTGVRKVEGDFVFALPGAADVGVSGGADTLLRVFPYEPVWIAEPGVCSLDSTGWERGPDGAAFRYYVSMFRNAGYHVSAPDWLHTVFCGARDADPADFEGADLPHFSYATLEQRDPALLDWSGRLSLTVDAQEILYAEDGFTLSASRQYGIGQDYADRIAEIWHTTREVMLGSYFPPEIPLRPVSVAINGNYPFTMNARVDLDDYFITYDESNMVSISHEMIHAIDQTFEFYDLCPGVWWEGRAEFVSRRVCDRLGYTYWEYEPEYDWSFLTEEDRNAFARYFCLFTNRETEYPVGYYFMDFLTRTYGADVLQRIDRNLIGTICSWETDEEEPYGQFLGVVTAETEPDVFRRFVREVVER